MRVCISLLNTHSFWRRVMSEYLIKLKSVHPAPYSADERAMLDEFRKAGGVYVGRDTYELSAHIGNYLLIKYYNQVVVYDNS